jgi:hypothetical protein
MRGISDAIRGRLRAGAARIGHPLSIQTGDAPTDSESKSSLPIRLEEWRRMYDFTWHQSHGDLTSSSARTVAPILCSLFDIESVLDVGCGDGRWLASFGECGAPMIAESTVRGATSRSCRSMQPTSP